MILIQRVAYINGKMKYKITEILNTELKISYVNHLAITLTTDELTSSWLRNRPILTRTKINLRKLYPTNKHQPSIVHVFRKNYF